jgi:hypothetical protein
MVTVLLENLREQSKANLDQDTEASLTQALSAAEKMKHVVDTLAASSRQTAIG